MTGNEKYQHYIIPQLQEFWNVHREEYIKSGLEDGLMLPYVFEKYDCCNKKIFYIGQDAPYWLSEQCMITLFDQNKHQQYVRLNNEVMCPLEKRLAWGNSSSAFWTMIVKLHIYLMTGRWYNDIYSISAQDIELLETIGYGNTNSIPLLRTIWNYRGYIGIQQYYYHDVVRGTYRFNHLGVIVELFEPDVIVILGRSFYFGAYFRETNFLPYKESVHVGNGIETDIINHKGKPVRLIWTYNPNYYKFIGENMHIIADKIKKYA